MELQRRTICAGVRRSAGSAELDPALPRHQLAFGETVAWNLSARPISLKTVTIVSKAPEENLVWEVHTAIPPNSSVPVKLWEIASKSWHGPPGAMFSKVPGEYAQVDSQLFEQLKTNQQTDKYVPTFLMPDSASYAQLGHVLGDKFQSFDCTISIGFTRLWDGSTSSIDVPCKGLFWFRVSAS